MTTTEIPASAVQVGNFVVTMVGRAREVLGIETAPVFGEPAIFFTLAGLDQPMVFGLGQPVTVQLSDHEF
jgi:hypothetical protein